MPRFYVDDFFSLAKPLYDEMGEPFETTIDFDRQKIITAIVDDLKGLPMPGNLSGFERLDLAYAVARRLVDKGWRKAKEDDQT